MKTALQTIDNFDSFGCIGLGRFNAGAERRDLIIKGKSDVEIYPVHRSGNDEFQSDYLQ